MYCRKGPLSLALRGSGQGSQPNYLENFENHLGKPSKKDRKIPRWSCPVAQPLLDSAQ